MEVSMNEISSSAVAVNATYENTIAVNRAIFIRRTYAHLAGAIITFAILETILLQSSLGEQMLNFIFSYRFGWLMILGAFALVGRLARNFAGNVSSLSVQYVGLSIYVVAEAIIFVPLLYIARAYSDPTLLPNAIVLTGFLFAGLTATVLITRTNFSFLTGILTTGGFVALGLIVCSAIYGFELGVVFSGAMILLACGSILYDTSHILHSYAEDQYVSAALDLFASVALLFWYVVRIMIQLSRR
jgi:FtsH-binding integral membrane protein